MKLTLKYLNEQARRLQELAAESEQISENIQKTLLQMASGQELERDHDCKLDAEGSGHCDSPVHKEK